MGIISKIALLCGIVLSAGTVSAKVEVMALPALSVETIGFQTGFDKNLWGSQPNADEVIAQINKLEKLNLSPAQKNMVRDILMTDVSGVDALENRSDFLTARLQVLTGLGLFESVVGLIDKIPTHKQNSELQKFKKSALWGMNQSEDFCQNDGLDEEQAFRKFLCLQQTGTEKERALAFDVYREKATGFYPWADYAGDKLYHHITGTEPQNKQPTLFEWPMVAAAFPEDVMKKNLSAGEYRVLALHEIVPVAVRTWAAENAFLSAEDWNRVLETIEEIGEKTGPEKRLALLKKIKSETGEKQGQAMADYLAMAQKDGVLLSVATAVEGVLADIKQKHVPSGQWGNVIKLLVLFGQKEEAIQWYETWQDEKESARALVVLDAVGYHDPKAIDDFMDGCIIDKACVAELNDMPFNLTISAEKALKIPAERPADYPNFVTFSVQKKMTDSSVAMGIADGILLLNASAGTERNLTRIIGQEFQSEQANRLTAERFLNGWTVKTH